MQKFLAKFGHEMACNILDYADSASPATEQDEMVVMASNTAREVFRVAYQYKGELPNDAPSPGSAHRDFLEATAFRDAYQATRGRDLTTGEQISGHARAATETRLRTENPTMLAEARGFVAGEQSPLMHRMISTLQGMAPAYERGQAEARRAHEKSMKRADPVR